MDKERRDWRGQNYEERVCEGKKAFNEVRDEIHALNYKLQERYLYLANCNEVSTEESNKILELQLRVKEVEHEKILMQS